MPGISRYLCLEPLCGCISMALIIVAAERRHKLVRLILPVDGEDRHRCLFLVAVAAVPA